VTVEVSIDYRRCRGHQMCLMHTPDVFVDGDSDDGSAVVAARLQPDSRRAELEGTAAGCPEVAILIATHDS
jgi:ferredoxin